VETSGDVGGGGVRNRGVGGGAKAAGARECRARWGGGAVWLGRLLVRREDEEGRRGQGNSRQAAGMNEGGGAEARSLCCAVLPYRLALRGQ
jgi:hypothetical protein